MKHTIKGRLWAGLLAFVILLGALPMGTLAAADNSAEGNRQYLTKKRVGSSDNGALTFGGTAYDIVLGGQNGDITEMSPGEHTLWGAAPNGFLNPVLSSGKVLCISQTGNKNDMAPHYFTEQDDGTYTISATVEGTVYYLTDRVYTRTHSGIAYEDTAVYSTEETDAVPFHVEKRTDKYFNIWYEGFTVTLDPGEGTLPDSMGDTLTVASGKAAPLPTPSRAGFEFVGWFDEENNMFTGETPVTADVTLSAQWMQASLRVTDAEGTEIEEEDGIYTIPAGGNIYTGSTLRAVIPMGVTGVTVSATAAETLTVSAKGEMTLTGGDKIVLPDGTTTQSLLAAGTSRSQKTNDVREIYYALSGEGKLVISGEGKMPDYKSTSVPWGSGNYNRITSLVVMDGITRVGNYICWSCPNITDVTLANSVTEIGENTFYKCTGLTEIELPASLTKIGMNAFTCTNLTSVVIPDGVTDIGMAAFEGSISGNTITGTLRSVTLPSGEGSLTLGTSVFANQPVETLNGGNGVAGQLVIPENVTKLGMTAFFRNPELKSVTFISENLNLPGQNNTRGQTGAFKETSPIAVVLLANTNIDNACFAPVTAGATRVLYVKEASFTKSSADKLGNTHKAVLNGGDIDPDTVFEEGKLVTPVKENFLFKGWMYGEDQLLAKDADSSYYTLPEGSEGTTYTAQWEEGLPDEPDPPMPVDPPAPVFSENTNNLYQIEVLCEKHVQDFDKLSSDPTKNKDWWSKVLTENDLVFGEVEANRTGYETDAYPWICSVTPKESLEYYLLQLNTKNTQDDWTISNNHVLLSTETPVVRFYWNGTEWVCPDDPAAHTSFLFKDGADGVRRGSLQIFATCVQVTVTIDPGEGALANGVSNTLSVTKGTTATLPIPTRTGYTFVGWQTADGIDFTSNTVVTGDVTVTAQWQKNPPESSSGGSSNRPKPPAEDLADPDTPLVDGPSLTFVDVKTDDWFFENVYTVLHAGIMVGTDTTHFDPQLLLTRGMIAQVLFNMERDPVTTASNPFADVTDSHYYLAAVSWGTEHGVLQGYDSGLYGGEDPITREQMAVMLYRYSKYRGLELTGDANALTRFSDRADTSEWAAEAVSWAVSNGLLFGRGNDILDPGANMTRAEAAAILARYTTLLNQSQTDNRTGATD